MSDPIICPKCQQPMYVGCYPFCPHGYDGKLGVTPDDLPGGMVMDNIEPGRKVYSKTELKAVLKAHRSKMWPNGCKLSENGWCGPTDQHLKRWDAIPDMHTTREERRAQMAAHLGMSVEEYDEVFPA